MSTLVNCNAKITELIYILKEETKLLRKGNIDGLDGIIALKAKGMTELDALSQDLQSANNFIHLAPQMKQLKRLAHENGILLKAVLNGLKSARERLQALQNHEAQVGAYNRDGASVVLSESQNLSEKHV